MNNRQIPKAKLPEGIDLCKENIMGFLRDARLIVAEKRLNHVYVMVEYAVEEFGKAIILKEALTHSKDDPVTIGESVFRSHKNKDTKAWTVLDNQFKTIFDEGAFDDQSFDWKGFETDTKASHETRLDCAFVDYNNDNWYLGRNIKEELLNALINHTEERLTFI